IFLGGNHNVRAVSTFPFDRLQPWAALFRAQDTSFVTKGDVHIGHDVWIGSGALILSGVSIGHGAVIAAKAVVTKDVPPYGVAAGNPAGVVRMRCPEDVVTELLDVAWWDLPDAEIAQLAELLQSDRVEELVAGARAAWTRVEYARHALPAVERVQA